ncbi:hypothetical protein Tco_0123277 [Tanacetum coccineum]
MHRNISAIAVQYEELAVLNRKRTADTNFVNEKYKIVQSTSKFQNLLRIGMLISKDKEDQQAGKQVSRPVELRRLLQPLKRYGRLYYSERTGSTTGTAEGLAELGALLLRCHHPRPKGLLISSSVSSSSRSESSSSLSSVGRLIIITSPSVRGVMHHDPLSSPPLNPHSDQVCHIAGETKAVVSASIGRVTVIGETVDAHSPAHSPENNGRYRSIRSPSYLYNDEL